VRPEESNALFEGYGTGGAPRRRGPIVAGAAIVLLAGAAIGAGAYAWFERGRAEDAELSRGQASAERDAAIAAQREAEGAAEESRRAAVEALETAERVATTAAATIKEAEKRAVDLGASGELLEGVVKIWAGGTPELAPPAVHELLRGEVLSQLSERLPPERYLALTGAAVRAMAIDLRARDSARVRVDFDFVKGYLAAAQKVYGADSAEMAGAFRNVAAMCFAYQAIPALDEPARAALRENARTCAERAAALDAKAGGRAHAESLAVLGRLARLDGDAAGAVDLLSKALAALGSDASARESAAIAIDLSRAELDLGKRDDAIGRLGETADRLAREVPFGDALELDARALRLSLFSGDERAAMAERLALGRVLVQLGRAPAGYDALAQAARFYAADQTRFRERLEASVWLARALDRMGSTKSALEMLDQPQLAEDARVFGRDTLLSQEYETTRAMLRMRLAERGAESR
jgi:tetratricopeptide (TPR) repeat protein